MDIKESVPRQPFSGSSLIRFGPYELDLRSAELRKHDIRIRLQEQPFRILVSLLERPGEVVLREEIRARLWPEHTVVEFDHSISAAVKRLRDVLGESADKPRYIETVARRGYRFIGQLETSPTEALDPEARFVLQPAVPTEKVSRLGVRVWAIFIGILVVVAASAFYHLQRANRPTSSKRVIPLTSYLGDLGCESFSPDGSQVTFHWRATNKRYYDIYVKLVRGGNALQLTREQPDSLLPTWSPDGSRIAFNRAGSVFLVSPLGQQESQLTTGVLAGNSAWSPDGRSLAIRDRLSEKEAWAIYSVCIATKEKRRLTFPPPRALDSWAAFSPDGTKLAFVRSLGANRGAGPIYVLPLKQGAPHGDPWRLTSAGSKVTALTWMPNGHEIIFAALGGHSGLSRIFVAPGAEPHALPDTDDTSCPVMAVASHAPLAFHHSRSGGYAVFHSEFPHSGRASPPSMLIGSTRNDISAQYSPDGKKIVFASDRSGNWQIWTCNADGLNPEELTNSIRDFFVGSPRWSADTRHVAFDGIESEGNNFDIYVVNAGGGAHRRLTSEPSMDLRPSWSHDGHWIYFGSNRSGTYQIWKSPAEGGKAVQITRHGGFEALEGLDGKTLFYVKTTSYAERGEGLWSVPAPGGSENLIAQPVWNGNWTAAKNGIYWLDFSASSAKSMVPVKFFDFITKQVTQAGSIGHVEFRGGPNFSVTSDARSVLWGRREVGTSELMMLENFR